MREFGAFFDLLLVAGNETTRNALAHGVRLFTGHPEQRELLLADYDGRVGGAIEEIVRLASPIIQFRRTLTREYELGGHQFAPGDKVVLFYLSANRDEAVFTDPDVFDITRGPIRMSASAVRARTCASERTWPGWSSGSCSVSCSAGCRAYAPPASRGTCCPTSTTASSGCPSPSERLPKPQ